MWKINTLTKSQLKLPFPVEQKIGSFNASDFVS